MVTEKDMFSAMLNRAEEKTTKLKVNFPECDMKQVEDFEKTNHTNEDEKLRKV